MLALVLVSAGIYGLLSYVLSLRRKEIGIRMALGADARRMARRSRATDWSLTAIGLAIGLAGALASVPLMRSVLVETSPYDPIAIARGVRDAGPRDDARRRSLPALRAARVEPLAELRQD